MLMNLASGSPAMVLSDSVDSNALQDRKWKVKDDAGDKLIRQYAVYGEIE
jgi:hypothetical protein